MANPSVLLCQLLKRTCELQTESAETQSFKSQLTFDFNGPIE